MAEVGSQWDERLASLAATFAERSAYRGEIPK
jgi:hypothetical protein